MARLNNPNAAKNLTPNSQRTKEELSEIGKKGAAKSNAVQKRRREIRETLLDLLAMPMKPGKLSQASTIAGLTGKNVTASEAMALAMLTKALEGDVRAAEFVRDSSGQKPVQQMEVSANAKEASAAFKSLLDEVESNGDQ
nr:MAG TPA: hypothetical protein [Caudoviricetes sp.]